MADGLQSFIRTLHLNYSQHLQLVYDIGVCLQGLAVLFRRRLIVDLVCWCTFEDHLAILVVVLQLCIVHHVPEMLGLIPLIELFEFLSIALELSI